MSEDDADRESWQVHHFIYISNLEQQYYQRNQQQADVEALLSHPLVQTLGFSDIKWLVKKGWSDLPKLTVCHEAGIHKSS